MSQLVEIDFSEVAEAAAESGELLEGRDALCQLFRSGEADSAAEELQTLIGVDAHEAVQSKGTGFAVGQMIVLRQRIAAGMAAGGLRQSEAQSAQQGGIGHIGAGFHVAAVGVGRLEVLEDRTDSFNRHQVGDGLVILAPVAFQRMGHGVQAGVHGRTGRHGGTQYGVDDGHLGHEDRVVDGLLLGLVADDGDLSHFTAGSGRGRDRDDGQALCREGLLPVVILDGFAVAQGDGRGKLRRVDGAAAADADDGVGLGLTGKAGGFDDAGELGILLHAAENGNDAAVLLLHLLRGRSKVLAAGDHAALHTELFKHFTELGKLSHAEINLDRLGIDKLMRHRCSPRSHQPWPRTCACWRHASLPDPGTMRWRGRS